MTTLTVAVCSPLSINSYVLSIFNSDRQYKGHKLNQVSCY